MARRRQPSVTVPTTFVGTFYDTNAGVYISTRKDGSITVGRMNVRGVNVQVGAVDLTADSLTDAEA